MHAELQWRVELFHQRRQPTGGNRAGLAGHHQHLNVMSIELQVVSPDLSTAGPIRSASVRVPIANPEHETTYDSVMLRLFAWLGPECNLSRGNTLLHGAIYR